MTEIIAQPDTNSKLKIEYIKPGFLLHSFQLELENEKIFFQVIKMLDSVYVWIGDRNKPLLLNIALAMQNNYDNLPVATKLLGDEMEINSKNIACRLSKKLNKVVYVSFNVEENRFNLSLIEKRLNEEIKKCSEKF